MYSRPTIAAINNLVSRVTSRAPSAVVAQHSHIVLVKKLPCSAAVETSAFLCSRALPLAGEMLCHQEASRPCLRTIDVYAMAFLHSLAAELESNSAVVMVDEYKY